MVVLFGAFFFKSMTSYVPAPDSILEFAKLLEEGKTVFLETKTDIYPKDFIGKLKDQICENEGVFESDTSIVTQAVYLKPVAEYEPSFTIPTEGVGLLVYLQR